MLISYILKHAVPGAGADLTPAVRVRCGIVSGITGIVCNIRCRIRGDHHCRIPPFQPSAGCRTPIRAWSYGICCRFDHCGAGDGAWIQFSQRFHHDSCPWFGNARECCDDLGFEFHDPDQMLDVFLLPQGGKYDTVIRPPGIRV